MVIISKIEKNRLEIFKNASGQRIDNFLQKNFKRVPKNHIYKIIRSGQVRVNSKRVSADYKLQLGDIVRIPPSLKVSGESRDPKPLNQSMQKFVIFEDESLIIADKPSGLAVHGGSGIKLGFIEKLRREKKDDCLELVHRLDRETSGLLLIAKNRRCLVDLHEQFREGRVVKDYQAIVAGNWPFRHKIVDAPLLRTNRARGERHVVVDKMRGQYAKTIFELKGQYDEVALLLAQPKTGRTHQLRVHLSYLGFPIIGDKKYGSTESQELSGRVGAKRMMLHATRLSFKHPKTKKRFRIESYLSDKIQLFTNKNIDRSLGIFNEKQL